MVKSNTTASILAGLRVIVIEDEPMLAMCLVDTVEDEGCVVVGTATNVTDALALVATSAFDVAVLDLNLYGQTVGAVASAIVQAGRAIVFSSGSGEAEVPTGFQTWPVLSKPYTDAALFAALAPIARRIALVI